MSHNLFNEFLKQVGEANNGADHGTDYSLYDLPDANSLEEALARYFSRMSTSNVPAQPAERWHIRTTAVRDADTMLQHVARRWFYEQRFSPKVDPGHASEIISEFITRLRRVVEYAVVYEVHVEPPMWYEGVWQDFAFVDGTRRWLLHFGFSD